MNYYATWACTAGVLLLGFSYVAQTHTLIYPRLRESSGTQVFLVHQTK